MKLSEKKEKLMDAAQFLIDYAASIGMLITIDVAHSPNGNYQVIADARPARDDTGEYEKEST